jgi:hypothetical protein
MSCHYFRQKIRNSPNSRSQNICKTFINPHHSVKQQAEAPCFKKHLKKLSCRKMKWEKAQVPEASRCRIKKQNLKK